MPFQLIKERTIIDSRFVRPQDLFHYLVCYFYQNTYCLVTLTDLSISSTTGV